MAENAMEQPYDRIVMRAPVAAILAAATPWSHVRAMVPEDIPWLAAAVWDAYPQRPPYEPDWDGVVASTQSMFKNEAGAFMPVASPVALTEDGFIAGAVTVVQRCTLRDDLPDAPYVLDCITLPDHRRQGVASGLLAASARALKAVGEKDLALTCDADNEAALALYEKLGFVEVMRRSAGS
ncbi:GNAT family N-acetyltransferase [Demequina sp. SYSU T00192]|uniref:GNAT family N-acetyltransferase n=1 Tax=Demequina litoralis TaxID=3051660 RepID=A0ABT8G9K8_9MICO|nr:GNAT family N-acetyltransferase [Demequina sp. SYSU T00192]MDN4475830.1 GNAT family N-acetyltransferase [Demequina sp. SYSU T00192]